MNVSPTVRMRGFTLIELPSLTTLVSELQQLEGHLQTLARISSG